MKQHGDLDLIKYFQTYKILQMRYFDESFFAEICHSIAEFNQID